MPNILPDRNHNFRHSAKALVWLAIIVGTIMRVSAVGSNSLVGDEIASLALSTGHHWMDVSEINGPAKTAFYRTFISLDPDYFSQRLPNILRAENQPPFYFLLLNLWLHLFGVSEISLRALSVLASVAVIPLTYLLGRLLFSDKVGAYGALIFAVAPFQIAYSRFTRSYVLLLLLAVLSTFFVIHLLINEKRWRWFSAYATTTIVGFYTHYLFILNMVFHWCLVIFYKRGDRRFLLRWGITQVVCLSALLAWTPVFLDQLKLNTESNTLHWAYWYSGSLSVINEMLYLGRNLALFLSVGRLEGLCSVASNGHPCYLDEFGTWISYSLPVLIIGFSTWRFGPHLFFFLDRSAGKMGPFACILWIFSIFAGPIAADLFLESHMIKTPYYFISASVPLYLLVAAAISSVSKKNYERLLLGIGIALLTLASTAYLGGYAKTIKYEQDFREVAHFLERAANPDDVILVMQPGLNPLNLAYYLKSDLEIGTILNSNIHWENPTSIERRLKMLASNRHRLWFLNDHGREVPLGRNWLESHCKKIETIPFKNLELLLFISCLSEPAATEAL